MNSRKKRFHYSTSTLCKFYSKKHNRSRDCTNIWTIHAVARATTQFTKFRQDKTLNSKQDKKLPEKKGEGKKRKQKVVDRTRISLNNFTFRGIIWRENGEKNKIKQTQNKDRKEAIVPKQIKSCKREGGKEREREQKISNAQKLCLSAWSETKMNQICFFLFSRNKIENKVS